MRQQQDNQGRSGSGGKSPGQQEQRQDAGQHQQGGQRVEQSPSGGRSSVSSEREGGAADTGRGRQHKQDDSKGSTR